MKKTFILLTVLFVCATSLSAQTTQKQADNIVKEYLQDELIQYATLYVHANVPSVEGICITTSNEEVFTAKYACWAYYLDENEPAQRRYLFVKEDNGNLLEVIASNDDGSSDTNQWLPVETTGLVERQENNIKLLYPNPTSGELTIIFDALALHAAGESGKLKIENVEIFDVLGRKAPLSPPEGGKSPLSFGEGQGVRLDISHLSTGIYLIKIQTETGIVIQKVIKN